MIHLGVGRFLLCCLNMNVLVPEIKKSPRAGGDQLSFTGCLGAGGGGKCCTFSPLSVLPPVQRGESLAFRKLPTDRGRPQPACARCFLFGHCCFSFRWALAYALFVLRFNLQGHTTSFFGAPLYGCRGRLKMNKKPPLTCIGGEFRSLLNCNYICISALDKRRIKIG